MKIEHAAIWTTDIERLKNFYAEFFGGRPNEKYVNRERSFESYFLSFRSGARLELLQLPAVRPAEARRAAPLAGYAHIAFSTGSRQQVEALTARLAARGYPVVSGPRTTGDGYYESVVLDPDGNAVEITV